jgi:transposase
MNECTTYVGLDVHKKSITAALLNTSTGEIKRAEFSTDGRGVKRLMRWLTRESEGAPRCCYEAGGSGYELQRRLREAGIECVVVAPSLVWRQPGERRKNDQRDAWKLASQLAAGQLTAVHPPTVAQEAVRELVRDRDDARAAATRLKQQIIAFLEVQGVKHEGSTWTLAHRRWLTGLALSHREAQFVLEDRLLALDQAEQRVAALDARLAEVAASDEYREVAGRLACFRGVDTLTAMAFCAELYGFGRFESPRALMAFLGLTPGERSSGERERRTGLTKAGNALVRRLMVEAAKNYSRRPAVGPTLRRRQAGQPPEVVALAHRALRRLHRRYWHLLQRGKSKNVASAAVARELVGFLWAAMQGTEFAAREVA